MICPLMSWRQEKDVTPCDCYKEGCAWWVVKRIRNEQLQMIEKYSGCAIKLIAERRLNHA